MPGYPHLHYKVYIPKIGVQSAAAVLPFSFLWVKANGKWIWLNQFCWLPFLQLYSEGSCSMNVLLSHTQMYAYAPAAIKTCWEKLVTYLISESQHLISKQFKTSLTGMLQYRKFETVPQVQTCDRDWREVRARYSTEVWPSNHQATDPCYRF